MEGVCGFAWLFWTVLGLLGAAAAGMLLEFVLPWGEDGRNYVVRQLWRVLFAVLVVLAAALLTGWCGPYWLGGGNG